jgi:hypothetical protein
MNTTTERNMTKLIAKATRQSNIALASMDTYHDCIPTTLLFGILRTNGFEPVQEDGTPWAGIFCGHEGRAVIDLAWAGEVIRRLVFTWFKMESGRFEIVGYVS